MRRGMGPVIALLAAVVLAGAAVPPATLGASHWHPRKGTTWQIQYAGTIMM